MFIIKLQMVYNYLKLIKTEITEDEKRSQAGSAAGR